MIIVAAIFLSFGYFGGPKAQEIEKVFNIYLDTFIFGKVLNKFGLSFTLGSQKFYKKIQTNKYLLIT